ncbi:MAG: phosphotransferase [Halioglobus sp.]
MAAITDSARMTLMAGVAAGRLSLDAMTDLTGSAMVYRADEVAHPEALSKLLNAGLLEPVRGPVRITGLTRRAVPSVSSNCHNVVLDIEEADGKLPASLFVKLPMESYATRWFMNIIESWRLESHFFREVARDLPLRTPLTYATAWRGSRFFLAQENLYDDPTVTLFTNPDMVEGPSMELIHRCLDAFARLHSHHFGLDRSAQKRILPYRFHPFLSPRMGVVSRTLNRLALDPCMQKQPGLIPQEVEQAYRLSVREWPRLLEHWFEGPLSLLHGDSHLGNFFVSGEEMGMLDWQAVHWGKGIRDVQYFLSNSVPTEVLAGCERELVNYYVEQCRRHGAALDADAVWQDYRGCSFQPLMTLVVSIGFGGLNPEQDAVMTEVLRRAVASVQRLDYPGWLEQHLA